ncbi:elongation factor [Burkholderia phage vB_BglM_WTB]
MQMNNGSGCGNGDGTINADKLNPHDVVLLGDGAPFFVSEVRRSFIDGTGKCNVTAKLKEIRNGRVQRTAHVMHYPGSFRLRYAGDKRLMAKGAM